MKQFLFLILMCLGVISTQAQQKPQYYFAPKLDDSAHFGITYYTVHGGISQHNTTSLSLIYKQLSIYEPRNFKYPPKGKITALYLWVYNAYTNYADGKYRFSPFVIRMGTTLRDSFGIGSNCTLFDEEKDLTTVISGNPYTIPDTTLNPYSNFRKWIKLPLQIPFMFDPNKNLVVQFEESNDSTLQQTAPTFIRLLSCIDSLTFNKVRFISCQVNLKTVSNGGFVPTLLPCIGFDLDTTGVSGVDEIKATSLQLYPNPATTTIHLSIKGSYTISTLQGAIVQQGEGDEANVGALPQGLYLVQLTTKNGERLVGRFLKE
ncbi:MAG TPA: T9SS type A sorting domain-containing protein [Flavipsychrobacter sp.]|nr:T9SS type A sorting domain-containing protein [Flavipsychrobacter sp.]